MTPEFYIGGLCTLGSVIAWLLFRNKDLKTEAYILAAETSRLREQLKEEYENFDRATADLKSEIEFRSERLAGACKAEHARVEELANDKAILRKRVDQRSQELLDVRKELVLEKDARKKVLSQKKSGEVRLGHIAEKLAPFLEDFTYDPSNASFLGQPIDYVVFEDEEIVFVEIKSGNAKLSPKQRHIKELIQNKCVSWKEIRID